METVVPHPMRRSLIAAAAVVFAACGGDANERGAATPESTGTRAVEAAPGDINAGAIAASPEEAIAFMAAADQSEIQAAQIAINKATDREVKQFAQKMQREHTRSEQEVRQLARQMNVNLEGSAPQGQMVTSLRQTAREMSQQLSSTPKGPPFDRAYIDGQVQAHQMVLENLQRIVGGSATTAGPRGDTTQTTASPQQAARTMIPHVQQHLDEARRIQTKLAGGGR